MDIFSALLDRNICLAVDEILKHLGDEELNKCRQVSKRWKSWIDQEFVAKRMNEERRMVFVWTYGRLKVKDISGMETGDHDDKAMEVPMRNRLKSFSLGVDGKTLQLDNDVFDVRGCLPKKTPLDVDCIWAQPSRLTHFTYKYVQS